MAMTGNTWLRALNAYCRWLHEEGVLRDRVKLSPLKVEKRILKRWMRMRFVGKGDKQRIVPFSTELRKRLTRFGN
jgi:hypothetical protein